MNSKDKLVSKNKKRAYLFVYTVIAVCITLYFYKKPAYNWDTLPYMGVVLLYENNNSKGIHEKVYAVSKKEIPAPYYSRLVDANSNYRKAMSENKDAFYAQLPFYTVKPLYTYCCWMFYKMGISLPNATVIPSAIAYFLISLLLFHWLQKYLSSVFAFGISLLLMLSPPLVSIASLSTPDAISGLLLLLSIYCITEKRSSAGTFAFSILAIFARLDNIIPALLFAFSFYFIKEWSLKISMPAFLLTLSIILTSYLLVSYNARSFGWDLLYYPTFMKQLNPAYGMSDHFSIKGYWALFRSQFMTGLYYSHLWIFFLVTMLLLYNPAGFSFKQLSAEQALSILFVIVIVARFILQPVVADRFYIPYYLSATVFLCKKYSFSFVNDQYFNTR